MARGWIKYRPLYLYETNRENYEKEIKKTIKNLKRGIPAMNKMFKDKDFNILLEDLEKYNSNVKQDYEDFQHVQVVWKKLKKTITENNKKLVIAQ